MAGLNKVMIIGNLGKDPEMRYTASGSAVTNFTVAVSRQSRTPEGESREETEWFSVSAWDRQAEIANQYLVKGRQVYVEGRLRTRSWDDPQSGEKKYRTEVIATQIVLLGQRGDQETGGGSRGTAPTTGDTEFDNMPF